MKYPFQQSPNYKKGRGSSAVCYVIIHTMSGFFEGTKTWFMNPKSQVSAHYLVGKKGQVLQMVKEEDRAWHVGTANPVSIGIEMEDASFYIDSKTGAKKLKGACPGHRLTFDPNWYTLTQLDTTAQLTAEILHRHKLPVSRVIGHNDPIMRRYNNNHVDPGTAFPWEKFRKMVQTKLDALNQPKTTLTESASGND